MASESPDSSPSQNKRLKTLNLSPKSKSKIEEEEEEEESSSVCCGICLSDDGKSIRGEIDSCDHYFCFVCIMEWAKVESSCPMCKRRFTTIRRPPKDGVFSSERVVNVPKRDQVYHLSGNATIGPFDHYSQVQCSVCHSMADECYLLLCDLCDSAAHTYCVGLGATVPEGDWFCNDCTVLRAVHNNTEIDADGDNQHIVGDSNIMPESETDVSIFDIVHESNRPRTRVSSLPNQLSSPVVTTRGNSVADEVTGPGARTRQNISGKATESSARTLHRCRNVHNHIRALRENWDALRKGSLSFPSSSVESGESSKKCNIGELPHGRSLGQSQSLSSTNQQWTARDGFPGDTVRNRSSCDIDKAWKMMNIAKSIQRKCEKASSVHRAAKYPSGKGNASRQATNISQGLNTTKSQQLGNKDVGSFGMEKQDNHNYLERKTEKHKSPKFEKQKQSRVITLGLPTTHSPGYFESPSSYKVQTHGDACCINGTRPLPKNIYGTSSNFANEHCGSSRSITLVGSVPGTSDSSSSKPELHSSSSYKVDVPEGKVKLGKDCAKSKPRKNDDAKSEIQSLVKLNLKLLSRDKRLGVDAFKEVARLATHTILAACGLELPKSGIHSFPSCVCNHTEQIHWLHKSTLMPNSCRECFYVFVKDVVQSIMFEKAGHGKL